MMHARKFLEESTLWNHFYLGIIGAYFCDLPFSSPIRELRKKKSIEKKKITIENRGSQRKALHFLDIGPKLGESDCDYSRGFDNNV